MIFRIIPGGAFVENTYILQANDSDEIILIDPGSQTDEIEDSLSEIDFQENGLVETMSDLID